MKDRYKILIICIALGLIISGLFLLIGYTFHHVKIRQYAIALNAYFDNIDANQTIRQNGNYLIGIDYYFHAFPAGIIPYQFQIVALTKDKSEITVQGFFAGKLIKGYILSMYKQYGNSYLAFLKSSIQESFRLGIQQFSLQQLISQRASASNYITNYVKIELQSKYEWIQVDVVSMGTIAGNISPPEIIESRFFVQDSYAKKLVQTIDMQKKLNVLQTGGYQMMGTLEVINSRLFNQVSTIVVDAVQNITDPKQKVYAANYIVNSGQYNTLNNQVQLKMSIL